ncbi:MAG: metal ABC transporter permease [Candidatus Sungbacteria bacterium]|nr:metal ABC transporter permease [Candidatus Sungbacteria bacterium]
MDPYLLQNLLVALVIGVASGMIGAFILLKRMALVGDALSHVALPGIALALAYQLDPLWGVLVFLMSAAILVWWLEQHTKLSSEALVGLLFTASLAIGIVTIPDTEILESLFGEFPVFSPPAFLFVIGSGIVLTLLTFAYTRKFIFSIVSGELAVVQGEQGSRNRLLLFLIFSCVVALGIKLVGTLLMGALTIIPASIARNTSRSMRGYIAASAIGGAGIALGGVWLSYIFSWLPGPTIILLGVGIFILSLFFKKM